MKFSKDVERVILDTFVARLPEKQLICPLCRQKNWILSNGFVLLPTQEESDTITNVGMRGLVLAALSCTNCGNTHLLNLLVLPEVIAHLKQEVIHDDIEVKF